MTTRLITWSTTLVPVTCCECGVLFGVPQDLDRYNLEQGPRRSFWCPNGHQQHYSRSEVQRLKERLAAAEARETHERDQRIAAERSASAYKGRVTRLKNRAAAGVCPCCNRSFENLRRHMASQHPDFTDSADE